MVSPRTFLQGYCLHSDEKSIKLIEILCSSSTKDKEKDYAEKLSLKL